MAITTVDGVIGGFKPPQFIYKGLSGTLVIGRPYTPFYAAGIPSAAVAPTPGIDGVAVTSYAGQIPFTNPSAGQNTYLARFVAFPANQGGSITLADRLWHNSGINITSTSAQPIVSPTFPARDNNGSSNGEGVLLGVEVSSTTGAGTPGISVSYTSSNNTSGTASNIFTVSASSPTGTFYPLSLASGDKGVKSIQSITLTQSWTSGTIHLVAYRPLVTVTSIAAGTSGVVDALTSGLPRMYDNTVPFLIFTPAATTSTGFVGTLTVTQG
jgi:hypothetical protein